MVCQPREMSEQHSGRMACSWSIVCVPRMARGPHADPEVAVGGAEARVREAGRLQQAWRREELETSVRAHHDCVIGVGSQAVPSRPSSCP